MFDTERKVQVTAGPRRWGIDYRFRQFGVGKCRVSVELQPENLLVTPVAVDVLRPGGACSSQQSEKRECGGGCGSPDPDSVLGLHSFSARVAGGWPGGSSRP
jgi:hypothetical protein